MKEKFYGLRNISKKNMRNFKLVSTVAINEPYFMDAILNFLG